MPYNEKDMGWFSADLNDKTMTPKEYFEKEYGDYHINDVVEMKDLVSLHSLMEEYAEYYHKSKAENLPISDVSDCAIRDWVITYADSDGTIQKAVVSGKDDDEAIANFQSDYHQEWRTIKAVV